MNDGGEQDKEASDSSNRSSVQQAASHEAHDERLSASSSSNALYSDTWPLPPGPVDKRVSEKQIRPFQSIPNLRTRSSAGTRSSRSNSTRSPSAEQHATVGDKSSARTSATAAGVDETDRSDGLDLPQRKTSLSPAYPLRSTSLKRPRYVASKSTPNTHLKGNGTSERQRQVSGGSGISLDTPTGNPLPPKPPASGLRTRSASSTWHEKNEVKSAASKPSALRTTASIPDYSTINGGYQTSGMSSSSTPRALHTQSAYTSTNPSTRRYPPSSTRDPHNQPSYPRESIRESTRSSALTNVSSILEGSGTERSSVNTDRSSVTEEPTQNQIYPPKIVEEEMSVDDAISMYADGFGDESEAEPPRTDSGRPPPLPALLTLNSRSPSSSITPTDGLLTPSSILLEPIPKPFASDDPSSFGVRTSAQIIAGHLRDSDVPVEDRSAYPSSTRDRYGFKKATQHVKVERYDAWDAVYSVYLERRRKKWEDLMQQHRLPTENPIRFPPKSDKVKRYIRKGIPPAWRGAAWFWYADGPTYLARYPGLYDSLVALSETEKLSDGDRDHIERDLYRTFPDNVKFKSEADSISNFNSTLPQETPMIQSLRRVLRAFALRNPHIGYCQSLNFLAGILLLFHDTEEKAFHMLCILTSNYLPGTHGVALEGANVDIGVLMSCIKEFMPAIWGKLDDRKDTAAGVGAGDMRLSTGLPTVSLATTAWFMSCFVSTVPIETACRAWDCIWYEGSKTLFRVALSIFKIGEVDIKRARDTAEVFQVVQTLPRGLLDANLVMEIATRKGRGGMGSLSQRMVERRREDRRALYRTQKGGTENDIPLPPPVPFEETSEVTRGPGSLKRSLSRATLKRLKSTRKVIG